VSLTVVLQHYLIRNFLQSVALVCHARGSTIVAAGPHHSLGPGSFLWFGIIGSIVFTSIQTQDLEDMEGDAKRDRKTIPLVFGQTVGRLSVALPVSAWSAICPFFWQLELPCYIPSCVIGFTIAFRVLVFRDIRSDKITWKLWCLWIITIYLLPLLKDHGVFLIKFRAETAVSLWYIWFPDTLDDSKHIRKGLSEKAWNGSR
jgi:4-hydroxybenzoate polyprenyltransferase